MSAIPTSLAHPFGAVLHDNLLSLLGPIPFVPNPRTDSGPPRKNLRQKKKPICRQTFKFLVICYFDNPLRRHAILWFKRGRKRTERISSIIFVFLTNDNNNFRVFLWTLGFSFFFKMCKLASYFWGRLMYWLGSDLESLSALTPSLPPPQIWCVHFFPSHFILPLFL